MVTGGFENKIQNPSWLFHQPTAENDEIIDFSKRCILHYTRAGLDARIHPRDGNYISLERPEQECLVAIQHWAKQGHPENSPSCC